MDDRYQIIQRTAELAFGNQFEATDDLINRKAQIHRFAKPGKDAPSDWKEIYNKVSGSLTTLSHMGLPIIYDRGVNDAGPYLIRQLVDEPTLVSRLEEGPLNEYEVWELAQQLLDIHSAGIAKEFFHGSLSPDRICYATRPGGEKRYYITDFGLGELHNLVNGTNEYFGLPCLICRRQAMGEAPSEVSEIFSIGQLLYLCLADNHPFAANRVDEMVELHKNFPLAPISDLRDDIPQPMAKWLTRMMAVDPSDRFQTYAEALENLPGPVQTAPIPILAGSTTQQQVQAAAPASPAVTAQPGTQGISFSAPPTPQSTKTKSKTPMIIGAAVAVILLIVGIVALTGGDDADSSSTKDDDRSSGGSSSTDAGSDKSPDSDEDGFNKGLIVALNFDGTLEAKNDTAIQLEKLNAAPTFQKGLYGKGLLLDKNHYYRLPLKGMLPDDYSATFTISFWIKNVDMKEAAFISDKPWDTPRPHKFSDKQGKEFWQWSPGNQSGGKKAPKKKGKDTGSWSMLSLVVSKKDQMVSIYSNGVREGFAKTAAIKTLDDEEYLYIGCDSRKKFNFAVPTLIDQLYIWDRKLSSKEIRKIFESRFSL